MTTETVVGHYLSVPGKPGDIKTIWDPNVPAEVDHARAEFQKLRDQGFIIYESKPNGEPGIVMSKFRPEVAKMIAHKGVVSG